LIQFTFFSQGLIFQKTLDFSYTQSVSDILLFNNETYVIINSSAELTGSSSGLSKYDSNGNWLYSKGFPVSNGQAKLLTTNDGNLIMYGQGTTGCDVGDLLIYIEKFDVNGNTFWTKSYPESGFGQFYEVTLSELSSGKLLMTKPAFFPVATEYIYEISSQGNIFDSIPISGPSPSFITSLDIQTFATIDGNQIVKFDSSGVRIDSVFLGANPIDAITNGFNDLVISTDNSIRVFNFNLIESTPLAVNNTTWVKGLKYQNGKLSALGIENQKPTIVNFDLTLNFFDQYRFLDPAINFHMGDFENSKLISAQNFIVDSRSHQNIQLLKYDTIANFTNASTFDVAITDIIIDDYILNEVATPNIFNINPNVRVEITNNGPYTLQSLVVSAYRKHSYVCGEHVSRTVFDTLNLSPGSAVKLPLGYIGENQTNSYTSDIYENLCIHITSPNGIADLETSDNELCETYSTGTVDVKEWVDVKFKLYPNPSTNEVNIEFDGTYQALGILSSKGKLVQNIDIKGKENVNINISSLPSGIYFLEVMDYNENKFYQKFIKH
jgi:hypothetical protein